MKITLTDKEYFNGEQDYAWDYWDEYAFGAIDVNIPMLDHNIRPKTNQGMNTNTKSACTIVWSVNQLLRLFAIPLENKEANELCLEVVNYCVNKWGYKIGYWWSTPTAINYVCKWWNEIGYKRFKKEQVFYLRLDWKDNLVKEALQKGHLVWFTYALNYWDDRYKGLVYKDSYPWGTGHRTNWKSVNRTTATWWADGTGCDVWVHDSYYLWTNEYFIKDRSKYMWKGMNTPAYLILPNSSMVNTTKEEVKENIKAIKAINATIWVLSTTWSDLSSEEQLMSSALATKLRNNEWARGKIEQQDKKAYQAVIDLLSYTWKFAGEEEQKKFSELASYLRDKFNLL